MTGLAPIVYLEGIKAGADRIHASIAPLANGNAQPAVQSMATNLRAMGFSVPVDDGLIDEVSAHFRRIAEAEGKPMGTPQEYDAFHYEHQIPGGMMSNFRQQLAQAGLSHLFLKLLEEVARVRTELGYPIMITPFAQLVGTQAVLNVVQGERYKTVPDEIKKYALGYYGKLLAPVEPDVLDRIVANGSPKIALKPQPLPPAVEKLRKEYPNASDDERVLRFMFAGNQMDEMLAAGPMKTEYVFEKPLVTLVRELTERKITRVSFTRVA
jgi:oxaloacetate decarboxylase alpha subunit